MSSRARLSVAPAALAVPSLRASVDTFLARPDLSATTRRSYAQTLERLADDVGADRALDTIARSELALATEHAWGQLAPATWNRHIATIRSFTAYLACRGWGSLAGAELARRREPADRTRALPPAQLERLLSRRGLAVRDVALWRLLYETAGRASEVLGINVEDLDLDNRRARVRSKGGDVEWLYFQTAGARLLPRVIAGRDRGPLFLADRRPAPGRAPAVADLCPETGRARLSYRRAEELFAAASGGWTLHQLRHTAITQLAERGVGLPLLMAKSRHRSLRSLQRYARPGADAVAALTAATDPARRR